MSDKQKRDKAVDDFAEAMKVRLDEKANEGYTGWDGGFPTKKLRESIDRDSWKMVRDGNDDKAVDIANRCMMLWFRAKEAQDAG